MATVYDGQCRANGRGMRAAEAQRGLQIRALGVLCAWRAGRTVNQTAAERQATAPDLSRVSRARSKDLSGVLATRAAGNVARVGRVFGLGFFVDDPAREDGRGCGKQDNLGPGEAVLLDLRCGRCR